MSGNWKKLQASIPAKAWAIVEVDAASESRRAVGRWERGCALAEILEGGPGPLSRLLSSGRARNFSEALARLSQDEQKKLEKNLGGMSLGNFALLGEILQLEEFEVALMSLGRRLEGVAGAEFVLGRIYLHLSQKGRDLRLAREAAERLKAERGAYAGEYFLRGLGREVFRASGLLAFGTAGLAGRAGQAFATGHLLSRRMGVGTARGLGWLSGFSVEVPSYVLSGKLARVALDREAENWDAGTLRLEMLRAGLALGFLKLGGGAGEKSIAYLGLSAVTGFWVRQLSLLGAVLLSQEVEIHAQLRESHAMGLWDRLQEALATVLHLQLSGAALGAFAPKLHALNLRLGKGFREPGTMISLWEYLKVLTPSEVEVLVDNASGESWAVKLKKNASELNLWSQGESRGSAPKRMPFEMKSQKPQGGEEVQIYYIDQEGYYYDHPESGTPSGQQNIFELAVKLRIGNYNYMRAYAAISKLEDLIKNKSLMPNRRKEKQSLKQPVKSPESETSLSPPANNVAAIVPQMIESSASIEVAKEKPKTKVQQLREAAALRRAQRAAKKEQERSEKAAAKVEKARLREALKEEEAKRIQEIRARRPLPRKVVTQNLASELRRLLADFDFMGMPLWDLASHLKASKWQVIEAFKILDLTEQEGYWRRHLENPEVAGLDYYELIDKFGGFIADTFAKWRSRLEISWERQAKGVMADYFEKNPVQSVGPKDCETIAGSLGWSSQKVEAIVKKYFKPLLDNLDHPMELKVFKGRTPIPNKGTKKAFLKKLEEIPDIEAWAEILFEEAFLGKNLPEIARLQDPRIPFTELELRTLINISLNEEWRSRYWSAVIHSPRIVARGTNELLRQGVESFVVKNILSWRRVLGITWERQALEILSSRPELKGLSDEAAARVLDWTAHQVRQFRKLLPSL